MTVTEHFIVCDECGKRVEMDSSQPIGQPRNWWVVIQHDTPARTWHFCCPDCLADFVIRLTRKVGKSLSSQILEKTP